MRYQHGHSSMRFSFGPGPITSGVKLLLITNVAAFLLTRLVTGFPWVTTFGLVPAQVASGRFWQPVTYLFLHGSFWHLFMNMFVLWMFGVTIERRWGTDLFLKYYFLVGIGAGVATWLANFTTQIATIGASGATVGILVAFAVTFPNQPILLMFLFPIPAKYFVIMYAALEFMAASGHVNDGVAHTTHLAGMAIGLLYLRPDWRPDRLIGRLRRRVQRSHLKVVRLERKRHDRGEPEERIDQAEIDAILDKISREGIDSLTEAEVRKLRERSQR